MEVLFSLDLSTTSSSSISHSDLLWYFNIANYFNSRFRHIYLHKTPLSLYTKVNFPQILCILYS